MRAKPIWNEPGRSGQVANSNLGNGNLRPETLGVTLPRESAKGAKPTAETSSPRIAVILSLAAGEKRA